MSAQDADEDPEIEVNYAQYPEQARQLAELQRRLEEAEQRAEQADERADAIEQRAEQADSLAKHAIELVNQKDERIETLETDLDDLRTTVDELREANAMALQVNEKRAMDVDDRAVACLQTLAADATQRDSRKAAMTISEGWSTLGREFDRTRMYDVFKRAESVIDDPDTCWYQKEPRGSQPPSRLMLDLSDGDVPDELAGHTQRGDH